MWPELKMEPWQWHPRASTEVLDALGLPSCGAVYVDGSAAGNPGLVTQLTIHVDTILIHVSRGSRYEITPYGRASMPCTE